VHDTRELETRGVPAVYVASSEFVEAGAAQARALGFQPAAVFVPHPIQDRTDAEMSALAEAALEEVATRLTG
jgi:hypothetical protein